MSTSSRRRRSAPRRAGGAVASAVLALACALALASPPANADPLADLEAQQQALFERLASSVVYISTPDGIGSGFFVNDKGIVLTNRHVVGKKATVDVVLQDGRKFVGQVLARGQRVDVALVKIPVHGAPALGLSPTRERVGSWVGSIGHGLGGSWTFTAGMVSNIYPTKDDKAVFQTQIPLNPGNSGGPIFDRRGNVLGIVTAGITSANNINFAIRTEMALEELPGLRTSCRCLVVDAPAGIPIFVNGQMAGQGPQIAVPAEDGSTYDVFVVVHGARKARQARYPETKVIDLTR